MPRVTQQMGKSQDPVADPSALWSVVLQALCWVLETRPWPRQSHPTLPRLSVPRKRQTQVQVGLTRAALGRHKQRGWREGTCSGEVSRRRGRVTGQEKSMKDGSEVRRKETRPRVPALPVVVSQPLLRTQSPLLSMAVRPQ